ncbi:MAG: 3-hydroxybutyryl-CoA dehydrogenase [Anaerolineales bacterium]
MTLEKIFVVGAGTMGNGIAQTAAVAGFKVTMMDIDQTQLEKAKSVISKSVEKLFQKEKISEEGKENALQINTTNTYQGIKNSDLVIEAATENFDLKQKIFIELDEKAGPEAILSSNTSSISLTKLAAVTSRPDKVIGMHFMNPVPLMKLVEVIRGLDTSDETTDAVIKAAEKMGKVAVEANDSPGFISNRILCPMLNEAVFVLQEDVGSREAIDEVMKLGMNHPLGPLALADLIGLDVVLSVMEVLQADLGEDKYRPAYLLRKMVAAGHLGRKTGRGFFEY